MSQAEMLPTPTVEIINNRPSTTSLAIAGCFAKEHKNVLSDIRNLMSQCPANFTGLNFQPSEYTDSTGRKLPMYTVFFDGFILLVMGYTGPKALQMKLAYIAEFNAMQEKLANRNKALANSGKQELADAPITPDQQCTLRAIVKAKIGEEKNRGKLMRMYGQVWSRFANHFRIAKYSQLPQGRMSEAVGYLVEMEIRPARELEGPRPKDMPQADDVSLDADIYAEGKRVFDELAEIRLKLDSVTGSMLFLRSSRRAVLSPEKQILFDNLCDCVRAAGGGVNIAILNVRSACRLRSRVDFHSK